MNSSYLKKLNIIHDTLFWKAEYVKRNIYISIGEDNFFDLYNSIENIKSLIPKNYSLEYIINAFVEQFYRNVEQSDEFKSLLDKYIIYKNEMTSDVLLKLQDIFISTSPKDISCLKNESLFNDCLKLIFTTLQHGYYPYTYLSFNDQLSLIETLKQSGRLPSAPILLPNLFDEFCSNIITVFVLYETKRFSLVQKKLSEREKKDRNKSIENQIYKKLLPYKNLNISANLYKYLLIIKKILLNGYCNSLNEHEKEELLDLYMILAGIKNINVPNMSRAYGLFIWDNQYITHEYKSKSEAIRKLHNHLLKLKIGPHSERFFEDKYYCTKHCIEMRQVLSISGANKAQFSGYKTIKCLENILGIDKISYNEYWDMKKP